MDDRKQSRIPSGRVNRMFRLGRIATGVASSALNHSVKQVVRGQVPTAAELLLNPESARRISSQLSQMRGAVMKIGQLLSMEAGDLLPRELTDILAELRDSAHAMPYLQVSAVLERAWGKNWQNRLAEFDRQPFAAASIGQVHAARHLDGRRLAIKIQYPGVAASIDSDIDNVASLLRLFKLLPAGFEIEPLLELARRQLHDEADYLLEARNLQLYRERLQQDEVFRLPEVIADLSGPEVLAMTFVEGGSIEGLSTLPARRRDRLATHVIDLALKEFLHWGVVQSDPNFANFLFNASDDTIGLLDFGALRINDPTRSLAFGRLLRAAMAQDLEEIIDAAIEVGYVDKSDPFNFRMAIADLVLTAAEPALHAGKYDFGYSTLSRRLGDRLWYLRNHEGFQRIPPADVIFLHRKLAGIYLLCARIGARVDVGSRILEVLQCGQGPARDQRITA